MQGKMNECKANNGTVRAIESWKALSPALLPLFHPVSLHTIHQTKRCDLSPLTTCVFRFQKRLNLIRTKQ